MSKFNQPSDQSPDSKPSSAPPSQSIQDKSITKSTSPVIEINHEQLVQSGKDHSADSEQRPAVKECTQSSKVSVSSVGREAKANEDQANASTVKEKRSGSLERRGQALATPSPTVLASVRALIKTNGAKCLQSEKALVKLGFTIVTKELAKGAYTSFHRVKYCNKALILKKLFIGKMSKRSKDLLVSEGVKLMRYLCSNPEESASQKHKPFIYFIQIYDVFLLKQGRDEVLLLFMEELKNRTINSRMRKVTKVKWVYIKRWSIQILSAISYLQDKGVAHRALRLEHVLLDSNDDIRITSWTRAVISIDPITGHPALQPKEPRAKRKNHLPPEVFVDKYDPANVDFWSFGVLLAVLCTKQFPFDPTNEQPFQLQWQQFCQNHQETMRDDILKISNVIFDFNKSNIDLLRQGEVREILTTSSLETETDEIDDEETTNADVIEDTSSVSSSESSKSS